MTPPKLPVAVAVQPRIRLLRSFDERSHSSPMTSHGERHRREPRTRSVSTLILLLGLLLQPWNAGAAGAQRQTVSPKEVQRTLEGWKGVLRKVQESLIEGESKKAYRRVSRLLQEMVDRFIGGPVVGQYLALATSFRAIAAYQMGEEDEALWHWHVALQMSPDVADLTTGPFGEAGPFLASRPPRKRNDQPPRPEAEEETESTRPPKKVWSPDPRIPAAKRGTEPVSIIVQAIIGADGKVRCPVILESKGELTLVYTSLDSLRFWRFEPAEDDGEAVPAVFNLTVNFYP